MNAEMAAALRAPFPAESIGKKPTITCKACSDKNQQCKTHKPRKCGQCKGFLTTAHMHLDFVGHAYVRERLIAVDPNWNWQPLALDHQGLPLITDGCLWITLTVGGKTMLGVGDAPAKRGGNALKEMIGRAIRNAALSFGVALDLWKKEAPRFDTDDEAAPTPSPPQAKETSAQRKAGLRGQIAQIGKAKNASVTEIADDFVAWSRGTDITQASEELLEEFIEHMRGGA